MNTLFYAAVLIALLILGRLIGRVVLQLGSLPGSLIAQRPAAERRHDGRWRFGLNVAILGRCYLVLAWVAFIIGYIRHATSQTEVLGWPLWIVGYFAAISLSYASMRAASRAYDNSPGYAQDAEFNVQHQAVRTTSIVGFTGFFVFVFLKPSMMGFFYGWLPYVE